MNSLSAPINKAPVDRFTLVHGAFGAAMGYADMPAWLVITTAIGWEFVERPLKRALPEFFPRRSQDSLENATFDALAVVGGWYAVRRARR